MNYLVPTNPIFDFNEPGLGYGIYRLTNAYIQEMLNAPQAELAGIGRGTLLYFQGSNPMWEQQVFLDQYAGVTSHGHIYARTAQDRKGKVWYPWVKLATCYCVDIEWKALPFMNGFVDATTDSRHPAKYRKGFSGDVVYVKGLIKHNSGTIPQRTYFAQLPEGYRPKEYVWYQICSVNGGFHNWRCVVETDGRLMVENWSKEISGSDLILSVNLAIPI